MPILIPEILKLPQREEFLTSWKTFDWKQTVMDKKQCLISVIEHSEKMEQFFIIITNFNKNLMA